MAGKTITRRRPVLTEEERRERRERDERVSAEAERVLSDPEQVAVLVDRLLSSGLGPNLLSYSLRNQALVWTQAQDRGIPLSDVYGKRAWNARGRMIKGPGLRIVAGGDVENEDEKPDKPGTEVVVAGQPEQPDKQARFWMTSVWDRSQTTDGTREPTVDDDPTPTPADAAAKVLLDSITVQLTRRGYSVLEDPVDAEARASQIDHDARTVAVSADWPARERLLTLALGLAQVLTLAAEARDARREARKAG